jgi:hypothetical protein
MKTASDVVLIGCCGSKLDHAAPARELYTSTLFKKARAYAEALGGEWAILSALHGLVMPDQVLEPYDCTFKDVRARSSSPSAAVEEWGRKTQAALRARWPGARFVFLGGRDYAACLRGYGSTVVSGRTIDRLNPLDAAEPLAGLGIGERLAWLDRETERLQRIERVLDLSNEPDGEQGLCDFCGEDARVAVSELGAATPARPEVASICATCASWALAQLGGAVA